VPPKHSAGGPRRPVRIVWHDTALKQITAMPPADRARLDVLLADISADPAVGTPDGSGLLRDYRRDGCRVLYVATALGSVVVVAYVEA
jgi:phage-related protein